SAPATPGAPASARAALLALPQEVLDRVEDRVPSADPREHQVVGVDVLLEGVEELTAAVPALDLAVAEQVGDRQESLVQEAEALLIVAAAPVVAVGEVEEIEVPLLWRVVSLGDLRRQGVGGGDARAAGLARRVEHLAVHLAGRGVVDDVAGLQPVVVLADPGVDPERLDSHDLLLLVSHRAGDVHHVDDRRIRDGLRLLAPRAVAHVVADRHDDRATRVVRAARELSLQRFLVRATEGSEAGWPGAFDPCVAAPDRLERLGALRSDPRQHQRLAHDVGQLVDRDLALAQVFSRLVAGAARASGTRMAAPADRRADIARPLPDAARVPGPVAEAGDVDPRDGDRDELLAPAADQLAAGEVVLQVLLDPPADDVLEAATVAFDAFDHASVLLCHRRAVGRRGRLHCRRGRVPGARPAPVSAALPAAAAGALPAPRPRRGEGVRSGSARSAA